MHAFRVAVSSWATPCGQASETATSGAAGKASATSQAPTSPPSRPSWRARTNRGRTTTRSAFATSTSAT